MPESSDLEASDAPGRLLASGRAADVYDLGDGTVLRRYRSAATDTGFEARVMRYVAERGYPVPAVHRADGRDLVMDRVDGPTMLEAMQAAPWKVLWYARRLARLQHKLAQIPAPDWLVAPGVDVGHAQSVLHLDLHPMNVIMSKRVGPTVIDWTNAAAGPAGFDAAITFVEMAAFEVAGTRDRAGKRALVEAFRRYRGRRLLDPYIVAACDHRLADANTEPAERVALGELRRKHRRSSD